MSNRWMIFMGGVLVAILVVASAVAVLKIDLSPKAEKSQRPVRVRNFGEGLKVTRHGLYGIDLVSIGKAHMRKLRKGPFTIGAINELVLEDVSLALPEEIWKEKKVESQGETTNLQPETSAKAMLGKLGINPGQIKMGGKLPRFSALTIRKLQVARIVDGTNAVPWFAAAHGKAERGGLKLENGYTVEGGKTNGWKEALLVVEPQLKLWTR